MPWNRAVFDAVEKNFYASHRHFSDGLFHGAELWNKEGAQQKTVETDNGNIFRNPKAVIVDCSYGADCHYVRGGKKRREVPFVP